jgi:hypothetical protein
MIVNGVSGIAEVGEMGKVRLWGEGRGGYYVERICLDLSVRCQILLQL